MDEKDKELYKDTCMFCQRPLNNFLIKTSYLDNEFELNPSDKPLLCLYCNQEVHNKPYYVYKCVEEFKNSELIPRNSINRDSLLRACALCHKPIINDFDKIKVPNCDHGYHKKCFEYHIENELIAQYFVDKDIVFDEQPIGFSCIACSAEISLNFVMYFYSWGKLVGRIFDKLQLDQKGTVEQTAKSKPQASLTCCKTKINRIELRNDIYTTIKSIIIVNLV